MAKNILQFILSFSTQTISTNTATEIIDSIADIRNNHKRARGIWCLSLALLAAGGGGCLFTLEPSVLAYFQPVVLKAFPFLGDIASKIGVGLLGAWFGGGFGHNVAKECVKYYSEKQNGVSNTAYAFTYADVEKILDANLALFNLNLLDEASLARMPPQEAQQLRNQYQILKGSKIISLITLLEEIQSKVVEHQEDAEITISHDQYKYALLAALRQYDLAPLIRLLNDKYSGIRVVQDLISDLANKLEPAGEQHVEQQARALQAQAQVVIEMEPVEEAGAIPLRVNPFAQHREQPLEAGILPIPVSKQVSQCLKAWEGERKDVRRVPSVVNDRLEDVQTPYEKEILLQRMAGIRANQQAKLAKLDQIVPRDLKRFIPGARRPN